MSLGTYRSVYLNKNEFLSGIDRLHGIFELELLGFQVLGSGFWGTPYSASSGD